MREKVIAQTGRPNLGLISPSRTNTAVHRGQSKSRLQYRNNHNKFSCVKSLLVKGVGKVFEIYASGTFKDKLVVNIC